MTDNFELQIPTISDFGVKYYFTNETTPMNPRVYPPHIDDSLEIYVLLEGDVSFMVESNLYKLSAGDAIVTNPNEIHNCIVNSPSVHQHVCFWFNPSCEFLFGDFLQRSHGQNNLLSPCDEDKKKLLLLYENLKKASREKKEKTQFFLLLETLEIFRNALPKKDFNAYLPIPNQLQDILNDISDNFAQIHSLDYFTEKYFISRSTLNRLFKTHLHTTPNLYLESKKLAYSRKLLKQGKSVLSSCMESGFNDYSGYIRLFKKRFGITPKHYRDG